MNGYTLQVETERLGGGSPMKERFHVSAQNEQAARESIAQHLGILDENIVLLRKMSNAEVDGIGLKDGEIRPTS